MIHTLRTHFSITSSKSTSIPLAVVQSLRQAIIGLARLPLVNSFVRVPPIVWKLGWQPVLEGPFKTELPPLPVEILKEKDVLREFIFRANAIGMPPFNKIIILSLVLLRIHSYPASTNVKISKHLYADSTAFMFLGYPR